MTWYVIVRTGGGGPTATGQDVPPWSVLSSVMLDDLQAARDFAAGINGATIYRLEPVDNTPQP